MAASLTVPHFSSLETLPLVILESICEYLSRSDSERSGLFAFSRASKQCCNAATRWRFERIRISVAGRERLYHDLERWKRILELDSRSGWVRCIKIVGGMPLSQADDESENFRVRQFLDERSREDEEGESNCDPDYFWKSPKKVILFNDSTPDVIQETEHKARNEAWLPLARFIDQLPGLKDLVWTCIDQIPTCVLSILHQKHPESRLHVHTFSLRSLFQPKDRLHDIHLDEFALITSPCLYDITLSWAGYETGGRVNYNREALLQMVAGLTPRLNSVRLQEYYPGDSLDFRHAIRTPRPPWQGFFKAKTTGPIKPVGSLQHLALDGGRTTPGELVTWTNLTDFSKLRSLSIQATIDPDAVQMLAQMAEDSQFRSLQTLSLRIPHITEQEQLYMDEATSLLLRNLPQLTDLDLSEFISESTFTTIVIYCGTKLRTLRLIPEHSSPISLESQFTLSRIQKLQRYCPNLEELEITIARTKGDEQEVAIFRELGTFPRLESLSLLLYCVRPYTSTRRRPASSEVQTEGASEISPAAKASYIRDCLINSAIDASLALSIFGVITESRHVNQNNRCSALQYLKLQPSGFYDVDLYLGEFFSTCVMEWISRSWICKRDAWRGHSGQIRLKELSKSRRMQILESGNDDFEWIFANDELYSDNWRKIWPAKTGDWKEDWSSFPLAKGDGL